MVSMERSFSYEKEGVGAKVLRYLKQPSHLLQGKSEYCSFCLEESIGSPVSEIRTRRPT